MSQAVDQKVIPPMQKLEVPGGSISYRRGGEGRTTVFLHAAAGSSEWNPFHEALAENRDLIATDHPGFGGSDEFTSLKTIDDLVYHYLEVFDALDLHDIDLIGSSFGGWIAAELAVHSPERFSSLVLLAPAGLRVPGTQIADLFIMNPPELINSLFHDKALIEAILGTPPSVDDILKNYRDLGATGRFGWNPYLCNPKLDGRLHRITARTRVVAAGDDKIIPLEHCERYASQISGAELVVIPDIGHALYGENPDVVARAVIDFLDQQD